MTSISSQHPDGAPLLSVAELSVRYPVSRGSWRGAASIPAVEGISLTLKAGETLGIVGESGCGKSTLARAILRLIPASAGRVSWLGRELSGLTPVELRGLRRQMQIVFQDPLASLDPRMRIVDSVAEPLATFRSELASAQRAREALQMLERVGLGAALANRYPHELSGGQCQRVAIARALILQPKLLVCDEPVSSLDVSVQSQVLELLRRLQRELQLSMLFISHNLAVVRQLSQRVMVLYLGRVMEMAPRAELFERPLHPYTRALLDSVPVLDPERERARELPPLRGEIPSPLTPPSGCVFRTRCPWAEERCASAVPPLEQPDAHREVACVRWRELDLSREHRP
ncbi:MAG TPA: oligopeptide/dipeptide ABC transporter ATP-binding protein [Steroidobacteraceae bacterium]|nr:oligopeptide/dipeptide ABC transporter ATP-binding protein [Steroidobacteraceae bacterium]